MIIIFKFKIGGGPFKINLFLIYKIKANDEQKEKWKKLCDEYKETREKIVNTKKLIFNLSSIILDNNDHNKVIVDYKYNKFKDQQNKMDNNQIKIVNWNKIYVKRINNN